MALSSTKNLRKLFTKNVIDIGQALGSLHLPGEVLTDDISAGWVEVGAENILRIEVSADTYVAFSKQNTGGAVDSASSPAVKLKAGVHYVVCADQYVRASANAVRLELLAL